MAHLEKQLTVSTCMAAACRAFMASGGCVAYMASAATRRAPRCPSRRRAASAIKARVGGPEMACRCANSHRSEIESSHQASASPPSNAAHELAAAVAAILARRARRVGAREARRPRHRSSIGLAYRRRHLYKCRGVTKYRQAHPRAVEMLAKGGRLNKSAPIINSKSPKSSIVSRRLWRRGV